MSGMSQRVTFGVRSSENLKSSRLARPAGLARPSFLPVLPIRTSRSTPMFRTKTEGRTPACMATFPDLALSFDLSERLIGAAAEFSDVRVSIDERPVSSRRRRFMRQRPTGCSLVIQHSWASKRCPY